MTYEKGGIRLCVIGVEGSEMLDVFVEVDCCGG